MKLDSALQGFLDEAISEKNICTVEGSIKRMITFEERCYIDEKLKPLGYAVSCFECETCAEYSNGTHPFHIERVEIRRGR